MAAQNNQNIDYRKPFESEALNIKYRQTALSLKNSGAPSFLQALYDAYDATVHYGKFALKSQGAGVESALKNLQVAENELNNFIKQKSYGYSVYGKTEDQVAQLYNQHVNTPRMTWLQNYNTPYQDQGLSEDIAFYSNMPQVIEKYARNEQLTKRENDLIDNLLSEMSDQDYDHFWDYYGLAGIYDEGEGLDYYRSHFGDMGTSKAGELRGQETKARTEWEKQAYDNAMISKILTNLPDRLQKMYTALSSGGDPDIPAEEDSYMDDVIAMLPADVKDIYYRAVRTGWMSEKDLADLGKVGKKIASDRGLPEAYIPWELDEYGTYIEDYYKRNTLQGAQAWRDAEPDNEEANRNLWFLERKKKYSMIPQAEDFAERSKAVQKELGVFRSNDEQKYAYINDLSNQRLLNGLEAGRSGTSDPFGKYYHMSPEEVGIYNYLHAQEDGQKKADEYLQYLEYDLNKRQNDHIAQMAYNAAGKDALNATIYSGVSIMGSILRGGGYLDVLWQRLFGGDKPIDYERRAADGVFTDATRQGVMDSVDWKLNIGGREYDAFDFLYSTGMSWADSASAGAMFGPTGAGVALGLSAAESTFRAAIDKGAGVDKALIAGAFAGGFEGLFEKWSIGELQDAAKAVGKQNFWKNLGWQFFVNADEELNTDLANMLFDNFIMGDLSDYNLAVKEYERLGMEPEEAEARARQDIYLQLAETALGGGLMGGGSATISSTTSAVNTASSDKQAGKAIIAHGTTQVLHDLADKLGDDTKAGKRLKKLAEKYDPKKATNRQTGSLYREVINALPQQMRAPLNERMMLDIDQKLKALGETGDTAKTADAIRAMLAGEKISEEQSQAIAQSEHGLDVAKDLLGMNEAAETETVAENQYPDWEGSQEEANDKQQFTEETYESPKKKHVPLPQGVAIDSHIAEAVTDRQQFTEETYESPKRKHVPPLRGIEDLNNEPIAARDPAIEKYAQENGMDYEAAKAKVEAAGGIENVLSRALEEKTEEYNQAAAKLETANKNIETLENTISGMEKDLEDLKEQLDKQEELSEQELQKVQADKAAIESALAIAETSLNGMTTERDELAGRVATLEGEKTALQDKYDKEVASHNQTKADLADAQTAHANTQAALDEMTAKQDETQTALNKTEADLKVTKTALNRANSTVKANRIAIEATNKEIERLQDKLANQEALSEQERQEVQAEIDRLKSDLAIAETALATSEQEYADLKEKFYTLQTDKDNLERQLAGKQLGIKILRAQMGAVAKAFETTQSLLRTKNEELKATQDALDKANTTITENEESIKAATEEIETLQAKLNSQEALSEQERQEAQAKIDELNADIDTYNTLLSQAQTDKTNLEGQIEILETAQAELEGQIATLNTDKANLEGQIATLQTNNAALEAQNSSLQTDNANLQAQNSSLQNDNANLQAQLDKQTAMTAAAEAEAAALQKEIDAVKKLIPDYRVGNDGEIVVNENGKAVPLEESSLSEDEQTIITAMGDADPAITQAAVNAYSYLGSLFNQGKKQPAEAQQEATEQPADEGMQDAKSFAKGFKRAVEWAKAGKNIMDSASPYVAELHEAVKKYAQQYGEALRQEEQRKQEQANIQQAHDNGFQTLQENGENVGVSFVQVTQNIGGNTKIQLKLIDMIARKRGLRVHVYDSLNDGKANGKFQKDTNLISVALDTEGGLLTRVVSHEIYHYIENWNKRDAKRIKDYVLNTLQNKEGYDLQKTIDAKIKDYAKNGKTLTEDEAKSEIVADSMLDVIGTEENLRQLMKQDRTLVEKISVELKKIVADLKAMMQRLSGNSAEVKALQGDLDYYSNILQMVDEALAGAKENYAAAQYKSAPAMQDSAVQEYHSDMKGAVTKEDAQAALNGMVSNLFVRAEKGWMAKNMDANLDEAMQKFADALKSYQRGEAALSVALQRAGFDAQPYEMNTVLSYAGQQLLRAEKRGQDGDVQYQIKQVENNGQTYHFVQADRQVISGDKPTTWGLQVRKYIQQKIRNGQNVTVTAMDGTKLTITRDTADKARFWNKHENGGRYSPGEYQIKLRIESHIDEAAIVSQHESGPIPDTKNHPFAKDGFTYRKAYFQDFDGKYYSFVISVGKDGVINTVYNVNRLKKETSVPWGLKGPNTQNAGSHDAAGSSGGIVTDNSASVKPEGEEQYSMKKSDIAKSVEEDAALFTQVKSDSDIADAMALLEKMHHLLSMDDGDFEGRLSGIADRLKEETGSQMSKRKLMHDLRVLYTSMNNKGVDIGEVMMYAREIAMRLLDKAPGIVNELDESTQDLLRELKNNPFYLTDDMKSEIRGTMGSVADYRRKNFGKMQIRAKTPGMSSLADVWVETLNPLRPDVFTLDATEADMPIILDAFLETANKKTYSSFFEGNLDQYATDIGLSILLEYYDLPGLARQGQILRQELKDKQNQIRTEYKQKYEQRMTANRERRQNTEAKQKMRKKLIKVVRSMYSKLHTDSDTKHVPQALKGAVSAMIRPFLDETGVFSGPELRAILQEYSRLAEGGKNQDIAAAYAYDPDIQAKIEKVVQTMDGRRLSQLTLEELTDLRDIVGNLNKIIVEQNLIQLKGRKMTLWELGGRAVGEQKMKKTLGPKAEKIMNALYINMTPIYYFKRLGGVFVELWDEVRKGQTKYIFNVKKAKKYIEEQIRKYNVKSWYHKENLKFTTQEGDEIELTMGNCLYLCATWKRELTNKMQDAAHLRIGGFVYAKTDANGKLKVDRAHPHAIGQADMNRIMEYMGEKAVQFVDETVRYLSEDMAALGNETSMERYGYEKFGESYYFPYKVDSDYTETNLNKSKDETPSSLFSWGASKKTTERANKPVVLGDYLETWANHVNEMCVYNGFAIPLDNLNRVYNFTTPSIVERDADKNIISRKKAESLRAEIARAHGKGADKYLADITKSIAGGQIGRSDDVAFMNKMVSKFRKNAVVLSASVAIQQPSSIMRAMAHINPKYFVGKHHNFRESYDEMLKYSGTANVKAMGKFDVGMGQSAQQWMLDDLGSGSKLKDAAEWANDKAGFAPERMDQKTWAVLWNAVKREQMAQNPMMDHTSEAFLQKCGQRFDEVVDLTQVYDSVLSRSKIMRSKDGWAQMITSFMAEPTLTTNMLMDALLNFKENKSTRNHVTVKRVAAVYAAQVIVNALLQSIVTAARDDDEDKTYLEKYLAEFTENFMDDINPLGNIPIIQDIMSIFEGYDVERADMALLSDLADAVRTVTNEDKTTEEKVEASTKAIGALFGVPVKNIWREVESIGNLYHDLTVNFGKTTGVGIKYSILEALPYTGLESGKVTPYYERMMEALMDGDKAQYTELESYVTGTMQKDEKDIRKGLKSALKEALLDGEITSSEAQRFLQKHCDMESDDAYFQVDEWLENEAHKNNSDDEEYSYSRYNGVYEAVKAGKSIEGASQELLAYGYTDKDISSNVKAKIGDWYISGEMSKSEAEKALAKYTGEKTKDINSQMLRWTYVKQKGFKEATDVYKSFFQAVETGDNLRTIIREMASYGYEKSDLASRITSQYKDKYITLYRTNRVAATNLKARLLTAYAALGYSRSDKSKDIDAWLKQKK